MSNQHTDIDPHWEARINAMLDGELSAQEVEALEQAAAGDVALAAALRDAQELQALLSGMPALEAPRRLRRKLRAIPGASSRTLSGWWPRLGVTAACLLLVVAVLETRGPGQPSVEEIEEGRRELALAFSYLGKASSRASAVIDTRIGSALIEPVTDQTAEILTLTPVLNEEYEL
jgi:anti-sigma factor RsiW